MNTALLRQSNPNWKAFFILGSRAPQFANRMRAVLDKYGDARLSVLHSAAERKRDRGRQEKEGAPPYRRRRP